MQWLGFTIGVTSSVDGFYGRVVQPLREWAPAAPKQAEPLLPAAAGAVCG